MRVRQLRTPSWPYGQHANHSSCTETCRGSWEIWDKGVDPPFTVFENAVVNKGTHGQNNHTSAYLAIEGGLCVRLEAD